MKPTLNLSFCDFWKDFNPYNNLLLSLLQQHYIVRHTVDPDIVFYSCFGSEYKKYKCRKIFYTGENVMPNYNECDYSLSFMPDVRGRNLRLPLYRWRGDLEVWSIRAIENIHFLKFCCMVVSNPKCKMRNVFFERLSKYKRVDSGGRYKNNIGFRVENKMSFIKDYKFVISFENSESVGYTTEKIAEPFAAGNVPVYWGNPAIASEFNTKRFVNFYDFGSINTMIDFIEYLDKDTEAYRRMLNEPIFPENQFPYCLSYESLSETLCNAVDLLKK